MSTGQLCSGAGICTVDGRELAKAPAESVIPGPVVVSFESSVYTVTEGTAANVGVKFNRGHGRSGDLSVPIQVRSGSAAAGSDFNTASGAVFAATVTNVALTLNAVADKLVEGDETVVLGFPATLPDGVRAGGTTTATVTLVDATDGTIGLNTVAREIAEGNSLPLAFGPGNGISFTIDQTIDFTIGGSAQAADYRVSAGGRTLSPPYSIVLPAGRNRVTVTISVVDDVEPESNETIVVTATHGSDSAGSRTFTIPSSDGNLPRITVRAGAGATEGSPAIFTLRRTGSTAAQLAVSISLTEDGAMLGNSPPATAEFAAASATATVEAPTIDDKVAEEPSQVALSILASGATSYEAGSPQTAAQTVADNDVPTFEMTLSAPEIVEGGKARIAIGITNDLTFDRDKTIEIAAGGTASTSDYALSVGGNTLSAPYSVVLPAGADSVEATLTAVDDEEMEGAETVAIRGRVDSTSAGTGSVRIAANDGHPDSPPPPRIDAATIDGDILTLLCTAELDPDSTPATGDFSVRVDGNARSVIGVTITGREVRLTLSSSPSHGDQVEFDYTPGTAPLRDRRGDRARAVTGVTAYETLVSAVGAAAPEGEAIGFRIDLSHAVPTDLDVNWLLSDRSARAGLDYENRAGTAEVTANSTSMAIEVTTIEDSQTEGDQTLVFRLEEPDGFPPWARIHVDEAEGTIRDDDLPAGGAAPTGGNESGPPEASGENDPDGNTENDPDGNNGNDPVGSNRLKAEIDSDATCNHDFCRVLTGEPVSFRDASTGRVRSRVWDFGDGSTSGNAVVSHMWAEPGFFEVELTVGDGAKESTDSRTFLVEAAEPAGTCASDTRTRCLLDSLYSVTVDWKGGDGASGTARVVTVGTNDSGLFEFFGADNWEVLIKILDGCALNGHHWVFGASTTDLGYSIRVTDTVSGEERRYENASGMPAAAIVDSRAFTGGCGP